MKVAIVGTGISGLGAAYLLSPAHEITVYEKSAVMGGHSRTVEAVTKSGLKVPVDTGFIVFNFRNYPLLTGLFKHLDVPIVKSDMSFGASINDGWLEYGSHGLFAQKRNFLRPRFWRMLLDILRFNRTASPDKIDDPEMTLGAYLDRFGGGRWFRDYYLLAMGAAIWSSPAATILQYPAHTFLQFFENHGLLTINNQPQWYTVKGGSREYVRRLIASFQSRIRCDCAAIRVEKQSAGQWQVTDSTGHNALFDQVIFACHADQAKAILIDDDADRKNFLSSFRYQPNEVVLHGDASFMPKKRGSWASWVYLSEPSQSRVSLTYWMNNLQELGCSEPVFVTLNPGRAPEATLVHDRHTFTHPVFDHGAVWAQKKLPAFQGRDGLWFCGAYQRYGFHEDGLRSAVDVAQAIGVSIPWP